MRQVIGKAVTPVVLALAVQAALGQVPGGEGIGGAGGQSAGGAAPGGRSGPGAAQAAAPTTVPGVVRTDIVTVRALTMPYSLRVARAAIDACASTDPHVAVVVVDTAGNPRLILVADGAKSSLVERATRKGFTAAALRQVTSVEQKLVTANPQMIVPPQGQNLLEPGGVPIRAGTQVIGAVGVEGGAPMEAEKCAQAGVDTLKDDLHPDYSTQPR
jgi:uncharacterized protein GlcG (DUF336 family)